MGAPHGGVRAREADAPGEVVVPREREQSGRDRLEHDSGSRELGPHPGSDGTARRPEQEPGDRRLDCPVEIGLGPVAVAGEALAEEALAPGPCKSNQGEDHARHRCRHRVDAAEPGVPRRSRFCGRTGRPDQHDPISLHRERRRASERPRDPMKVCEIVRIPFGEDCDRGLAVAEPDLDF